MWIIDFYSESTIFVSTFLIFMLIPYHGKYERVRYKHTNKYYLNLEKTDYSQLNKNRIYQII